MILSMCETIDWVNKKGYKNFVSVGLKISEQKQHSAIQIKKVILTKCHTL